MPDIDALWKLQDLDARLQALDSRRRSMDRGERARALFEEHQASLRELDAEFERLGARQAELEGKSASLPRGALDEDLLLLMERLEILEKEPPGRLAAVGEAEDDLRLRLEEAAENERQLEARRLEWQLARDNLAGSLEWTAAYERLRAQGGPAVVGMKKGACLGCHMALSDHDLRRIQARQVVQCGTCGRFVGKDPAS